jgi:hypothetical protein
MTGAVARAVAVVGLALAIVGAVGTAVVRYWSQAPFAATTFGFGGAAMVGYLIAGLTWASIGTLLVFRRPANAVGWLMVAVGVGFSLSQLTVSLTFAFLAEHTAPGERLAQITGWITVLLQLVAILQLAIGFLFPTGHAQSNGWHRFMRLFWVIAMLFVLISLTQPGPLQLVPAVENPIGFGPDLRGGRPIAPILALGTLIIFASLGISMITRFRTADRVERQQLKWFVLALGVSAIALGVATWESVFMDGPVSGNSLTVYVFSGALVPVAIGIAILRYRLYEIDRIISRTIGWAIVTGVLLAVFAGTVVGLQAILSNITQGETVAVAASTLVAFFLFQPLRRRVQSVVDRRFNRAGYDAERTARDFAERLRDQVDLATLGDEVSSVVDTALRPRAVGLWIRASGRGETP